MTCFNGRKSSRMRSLASFSTVSQIVCHIVLIVISSLISLEFTFFFCFFLPILFFIFTAAFSIIKTFLTDIFQSQSLFHQPLVVISIPECNEGKLGLTLVLPTSSSLEEAADLKPTFTRTYNYNYSKEITKLIKMDNCNCHCKSAMNGCNCSSQINSFTMKEWVVASASMHLIV